jgi:hypothetical protein
LEEAEATRVSAGRGAIGGDGGPEALCFAKRRTVENSPSPSPSNASADRSRYEGSHEAVSEATLRVCGADAQGETHPASAGIVNRMHVLKITVLA